MLILLFFPYITLVSFGTDIQPWGIIVATVVAIILLLHGYKFKKVIILLLLPMAFSFLLFPLQDNQFNAIRSMSGYATIALIPLVFHYALKHYYINTINCLKFAVIVYLVVGTIQLLIDPSFMSFLLNRAEGGGGRGVYSLSSEPTFYGLICLFLILTFSALETPNKLTYIYLLLFQIIVIAQSSMVILLLLISLFFYLLFKLQAKALLITFLVSSSLAYLIVISDVDSRFIDLGRQVVMHPELILLDGSINSRIGAIYFSVKGFFDSYGIPNGFSAFSDYWSSEIIKQDILFQSAVTAPVRIMSFYGGILFELGIVGLLIPIAYSRIIFNAYKNNTREVMIHFFSVHAILFTAIPMTLSVVGLYFGALIYKAESRKTYDNPTIIRSGA